MKKKKTSLDTWYDVPEEMMAYLRNNGWHFNKKACDYAVDMMVSDETGEKLKPWTKEQVDGMLEGYGIKIEDKNNYDYVYVANMCKADYLKSAVPDERSAMVYVKKTIEDKDAADGHVMRRWYSDMVGAGEMIFWEELI